MPIPYYSYHLSTEQLSQIFKHTTASYKFFWMLALLDFNVKRDNETIAALDLAARMVAYAHKPTIRNNLSFGNQDKMKVIAQEIAKFAKISIEDDLEQKYESIKGSSKVFSTVKTDLKHLLNNVPYFFLSPWIQIEKGTSKNDIILLSQRYENGCLYKLTGSGENLTVTVNPLWSQYLKENYTELKNFALKNLLDYTISKNPNVSEIKISDLI